MKCSACGVDLNAGAAFCHKCGAKVPGAAATATPAASDPGSGRGLASGARRDDPEVELWTGGYSPKAMFNSLAVGAVLTIGLIVAGVILVAVPFALPICLGIVAVIWVWLIAVLLYRRMNISYRLTSQRFFHQTGILTRTTNRIEVIEMDDVTFTQNLIERLVGVGTIKITSSDSTDPVLIMTGIDNVQEVSEIIDKARRKELTRRGLRIESV